MGQICLIQWSFERPFLKSVAFYSIIEMEWMVADFDLNYLWCFDVLHTVKMAQFCCAVLPLCTEKITTSLADCGYLCTLLCVSPYGAANVYK